MTLASSRAVRSNQGKISYYADEALARFRIVTEGSDADHVKYPDAVDVRPVGLTVDGCEAAEDLVSIDLFGKGDTKVVKLNGTCSKGDKLVAEDFSTDATGKARALPTAAGAYWVFGTALEAGADEQEVAFEDCEPYRVVVQAHIADPATQTQDALTDNSGGTPGTTIAAIGATYTQSEVRNAVATLAAQLAKVKTDLAAVRTTQISVLSAIETAGVVKTS